MTRPMRIDVWSDLVCPWCYIGKRRLERALAAFAHRAGVQVVHRSFQLDPSAPAGAPRPRRDVLRAKYGWTDEQAAAMDARMVQLASADGLEYHLADGVTGNTADAHALVHLGTDRGIGDTVIERLYRAHFTERRSLFERESLVALAAEAGLEPADAERTLADRTYAAAVAADHQEARTLGATGVPFFVLDQRYGISGAQEVDVFTRALDQAWAEASAVEG